jgi:hypothetical protein
VVLLRQGRPRPIAGCVRPGSVHRARASRRRPGSGRGDPGATDRPHQRHLHRHARARDGGRRRLRERRVVRGQVGHPRWKLRQGPLGHGNGSPRRHDRLTGRRYVPHGLGHARLVEPSSDGRAGAGAKLNCPRDRRGASPDRSRLGQLGTEEPAGRPAARRPGHRRLRRGAAAACTAFSVTSHARDRFRDRAVGVRALRSVRAHARCKWRGPRGSIRHHRCFGCRRNARLGMADDVPVRAPVRGRRRERCVRVRGSRLTLDQTRRTRPVGRRAGRSRGICLRDRDARQSGEEPPGRHHLGRGLPARLRRTATGARCARVA